ncbi:DUF1707 domain-containing protein [Nocardia sp. NPDC059246]|uniref:DUF1707 SHOCT-like domain-containing protein n=1 Tax=unclassified Nocardia TaxID=2637762 RepID=UPI00369172F1
MSEPVHPNDIRISDAERKKLEETLRRAVDAGVLDLGEFDSRVQSIWQARTRGELAKASAPYQAAGVRNCHLGTSFALHGWD